MKIVSLFAAALITTAGSAAASAHWSGTMHAGDYRITATLSASPDSRSAQQLSVSLAPDGAVSAQPMTLHAWFIDQDGVILAPAALAQPTVNGATLTALSTGVKVPATAAALVVLAQPAPLYRASTASQPAVVAQIALPQA